MARMVDGMARMLRGEIPPPAAATKLGMRLTSFAAGEAVVTLDADATHANPMGTVQGGILAAIADAAMGWAYMTTLAEGESYTTLELKTNFLRPVEQDLGASRVAITAAFSIGLGVAALAALPVGRWIDRHGGRALMTVGSCLATLLTLAWARVESLPALYAVWFLMGLAMAATLYEPAFAVVVSWFRQCRDRALLTLTLVA